MMPENKPALGNFSWLEEGKLAGCAYPSDDAALAELTHLGISLLINLHERAHEADALARHGLAEVHVPVPDYEPPTLEQIDRGVSAIQLAMDRSQRVAVHCGAGIGRTGTLLACYLVRTGLPPRQAIAVLRAARPRSIETPEQARVVESYADHVRGA
jgi:atypical dual specificity phosphatase